MHSGKAGIAKVVEPAKLDGLLAGTRADGSFFKLPEDCQLVEAAFCVASEDNDRDMISAEDDGKLLKRWRRNSRRACLRAAALGPLSTLSNCSTVFCAWVVTGWNRRYEETVRRLLLRVAAL